LGFLKTMLTAELETATANIVFKPATFFPSVALRESPCPPW
jgi:hypothetical protein